MCYSLQLTPSPQPTLVHSSSSTQYQFDDVHERSHIDCQGKILKPDVLIFRRSISIVVAPKERTRSTDQQNNTELQSRGTPEENPDKPNLLCRLVFVAIAGAMLI